MAEISTTFATSKPIVKTVSGGFDFTWCEGQEWVLLVQLRRISVNNSREIYGELSIEHEFEDVPKLPPTRFNLLTPRSRADIVQTIKASVPLTLNWTDLINQICEQSLERIRRGEPVQELWTSDEIREVEYLIHPLIIKDIPNLIFGEKGSLKSTTALVFYIILTLPWHDNPLGLKAPDHSVKTLILDWELPGSIALRNAKHLVTGMGLPDIPILHRHCSVSLADDIENILDIIEQEKIECLIIDSLGRAAGGELKDTESPNRFFSALDKTKCTSLILAQTSKDREAKTKSIFGSTFFRYYARSVWEICRSEASLDHEVDIGLFHRDSNLTQLHGDMAFSLTFTDSSTTIERREVTAAEFKGKVKAQLAILEVLKSGKMNVQDISSATGIDESTVRPLLTKLKKKKKVQNLEKGIWEHEVDQMVKDRRELEARGLSQNDALVIANQMRLANSKKQLDDCELFCQHEGGKR